MAIRILMPALSPTMKVGKLVKWHVKQGDSIEFGTLIADIETDKAVIGMESTESGVMADMIAEGSSDISVNDLIAVCASDGEDYKNIKLSDFESDVVKKDNVIDAPVAKQESETPVHHERVSTTEKLYDHKAGDGIGVLSRDNDVDQKSSDHKRVFISPLAKKIANENGIDIRNIQGSGPNGRIRAVDINASTNDLGIDSYEDLSDIQRGIASHTINSKQQAPHFYLFSDIDVSNLMGLKRRIKIDLGERVSLNTLFCRAASLALSHVKNANVGYADGQLVRFGSVKVGIIVAIPGDGLAIPLLSNLHRMDISNCCKTFSKAVDEARSGNVKHEYGGALVVSSLSNFDVESFLPILNIPMPFCMGIGCVREVPVVKSGKVIVTSAVKIGLSVDHRVINGVVAAELLQKFKQIVEDPVSMLLYT